MSYRTFKNEQYFKIPEIDPGAFTHTLENVGQLFRGIAESKKKQQLASDQYNFDLGQGKFENDDKIFQHRGYDITRRAKEDIVKSGRISPENNYDQQLAKQDKNKSDWQFKAFTDMNAAIDAKSKEDQYYDPDVDKQNLKIAAYGEDNDIYYGTRGERLEGFNKIMFKDPKSLRGHVYTHDYVGTFRKKEESKISSDPNFKSSTYAASPFINAQGVPGVTVDHAKEYLSSRPDGSVARWIESRVNEDMMNDVKYMRDRSDVIKKMSDTDALLYLKAHPDQNLVDKRDYASRVIEKAQGQLAQAAEISKRTDYESKVDKSATGGLYTNDNIGHSYSDHVDNVDASDNQGGNTKVSQVSGLTNNMPGGNLRIAKGSRVGAAIPLDINPSFALNTRNGKVSENVGTTTFNLTGYQLSVYDDKGRPVMMTAERIKNMPLSEFKKLAPELGVSFRGYSVDQGNKLGEVASRQSELDEQKAEAIRKNDTAAVEAIDDQMENLRDLRAKMNLSASEFSDDDLISSMKQNGIKTTSVRRDLIVKPSDSDIQLVNKTLTRGLDLRDQKKWSPEMRALNEAYTKRWKEAQSEKVQAPAKKMADVQKGLTDRIKKARASVKPGEVLVMKDNKLGTIPKSQLKDAQDAGYEWVQDIPDNMQE